MCQCEKFSEIDFLKIYSSNKSICTQHTKSTFLCQNEKKVKFDWTVHHYENEKDLRSVFNSIECYKECNDFMWKWNKFALKLIRFSVSNWKMLHLNIIR